MLARNHYRGDLRDRFGHDCSVTADPSEGRPEEDERGGPLAWLSSRAGLVILVVIGAIVGLRLVSRWLKWLLLAVVVGAAIYLIKSRPGDDESREG